MQTEERFDIVVIGIEGDAHAATLAADLSAVVGLPPGEVTLALRHGELYVHRSFGEDDACRAADSLRRIGAEVEIRPTETSGASSVIEADPEALRKSLGGIRDIDADPAPIAPPPAFGGTAPEPQRSHANENAGAPAKAGLFDPSRPQGRPAAPERPFALAMERAVAGRRRGVAAAAKQPRAAAIPELEPDPEGRKVAPPRRPPDAPPPRGAAGSIDPVEELARQIEAAADSGGLEIVTLDGESSDSVELKLQKTPARPADPPRAIEEARTEVAAGVPREEPLALDLARPPTRGPVIPDPPLAAAQLPTSAETSYSSGRAPSASGSFPQPNRSPAPLPEARRLFSSDVIANYMFGVAAGLVIGLVVAFQASRMLDRDDIIALEDRLAESYVKPIEVESGELQKPQGIEADLEKMYGDTRTFFLLTMIFTGVPAGLALGRIKLG